MQCKKDFPSLDGLTWYNFLVFGFSNMIQFQAEDDVCSHVFFLFRWIAHNIILRLFVHLEHERRGLVSL